MKSQFTWIPLYKELADELSKWKNRQQELIDFLVSLRDEGYMVTPLVDIDANGNELIFEEIDPFTFFGTFNRKITDENRISILEQMISFFSLKNPLPIDFAGVPVLHPQASRLLGYKYEREKDEVEILWNTFILALSENALQNEEFQKSLDNAFRLKGVARRLTIGLYWIRPHTYLNLDTKNCQYIDIELPSEITSDFYLKTIMNISNKYDSLPQLSLDAWKASGEDSPSIPINDHLPKIRDMIGSFRPEINYWIFQCNPKYYDLESAILNLEEISFTVNQHKDEIQKGDIAFLWVSGKNAGIVGTAKIISNPAIFTTHHPEENKYTIDKDRFEGEQLRVKIEIQDVLKKSIARIDILKHPTLSNLTIIRSPQGTNYRLTSEEAKELINLVTQNITTLTTRATYTIENLEKDLGFERDIIEDWLAAIKRKKQVVFYGPPGTGKTYAARKIAKFISSQSQGIVEIVQFHPSYAYEDFVQGIRPKTREDGNLEYAIEDGRLKKFCDNAREIDAPSVLIIDEINRAELSRVFGELMYLLEYRDEQITLASGENFSFPKNVYIIGTMNTADRSIALVDHALRRRFAFLRLYPDYNMLIRYHTNTDFNSIGLIDILERINLDVGDINYSVGVTFFLIPNIQKHIKLIWQMEIEPYLEEYFFDDQSKVDNYRWDKISEKILG